MIEKNVQDIGDIIVIEEETPKEDATGQDETNGQNSADYSPGDTRDGDGDVRMGSESEKWDERDEKPIVVIEDEDDADSLQVNYRRYPTDLPRLSQTKFCIDTDAKVGRYLMFKVAQFAAGHFVTWKRNMS